MFYHCKYHDSQSLAGKLRSAIAMSDPCCNEKLKAISSTDNSRSDSKCKTYADVGVLTVAVIGVWVYCLQYLSSCIVLDQLKM